LIYFDLIYLILFKGLLGKLKFFSFAKINFPKDFSKKIPLNITLNNSSIKDLYIQASNFQLINKDLLCIFNSQSQYLFFFKIQFNNSNFITNIFLKLFENKLNLKEILFPYDDPDEIIIDINYIKPIKEDCIFISVLQTPKEKENPGENFISISVFINFENKNNEEIIENKDKNNNKLFNIRKITYFFDTYFPNDEENYNFSKTRPVFEASETLYDK
jgi:hypothetical protein